MATFENTIEFVGIEPFQPSGTTWLRIERVICISPAGGINDVARFFASFAGGLILEPLNALPMGEGVVILASAASVVAFNPAAIGGMRGELPGATDAGESILVGLDNIFAGADDLFMTVNDKKIWPRNRSYADADAGDIIEVGYATELTGDVTLELWEDDTFGEDTMGSITLRPQRAWAVSRTPSS